MFELLGYKSTEVGMQYVPFHSSPPSSRLSLHAALTSSHLLSIRISFGKGPNFWSNVFPSDLTRKFQKDIEKFGRVLKTIKRLEVIFAFIPVHVMLKMFRFSEDFGDRMVYPLVALFFGACFVISFDSILSRFRFEMGRGSG